MWYLVNPTTPDVMAAMRAGLLGYIDTPKQGNKFPGGVAYCLDNGIYGKGWPGEDGWYKWLTDHPGDRSRCLFATAPDVVGDAAATLTRSRPWLQPIRDLGYPAAYVAQDGSAAVPPPWGQFDVLFLGGTTRWKLGAEARALAFEATNRGVPVHMGRVNSHRRFIAAVALGCASVDGTYLTFGPDINLPKALGWVREARSQPGLFDIRDQEAG